MTSVEHFLSRSRDSFRDKCLHDEHVWD